jgi:prepilin-type processing-associated H-X9-DG protein
MTKTLRLDDLRQFTGTDQWYRHGLARNILFTDGAKFVADEAGAYWLLDEIAFAQRGIPTVEAEEFQVWILRVTPQSTATLTCEDGNGHTVFSKEIAYTDFPLPEITLWFANNVILLPSEY